MQIGKLRHRVTIEEQIETQDPDTGAVGVTWATVHARIPAEVLPDRAAEFFGAQQIQSTANAMIRMRWVPGITGKMRVIHHVRPGIDEVWDIEGAVHFQSRQRELRLMCLYREADGFRSKGQPVTTTPPAGTPTADSDLITADSDLYTADAA